MNEYKFNAWKNNLGYLPKEMNTFDKFRKVFLFLHECIAPDLSDPHYAIFNKLNYRDSTIYTIDIFLWVLADYGYTLQRSKLRNADFHCLTTNMHKFFNERENRRQVLTSIVTQPVSLKIENYRKEYCFLPEFMKDFHDQKILFRYIRSVIDHSEKDHILNVVDDYSAHIYIIDYFLYIMAKYGYTLQKSRMKFDFEDINESLKNFRNEEGKKMLGVLLNDK